MRVYYVKKAIKHKTKAQLKAEEEQKKRRIEQLKGLYLSVGIKSRARQKDMSCLLYRFKKCNPYYNLLYTVYRRDNSWQDYFNLCYMVAYENEPNDFKQMYHDLQVQIETETVVTRKQKAKQVYKPLSISELKKDIPNNDENLSKIEENIDLMVLYNFIEKTISKRQLEALKAWLTDGTKIDSRQRKRIIDKLKNSDISLLLR